MRIWQPIRCQMVAVFAKNGDGYQYSVIARNTDISAFIKEMNQVLNGRGGGRDGFAQGSVKCRRKEVKADLTTQGICRNLSITKHVGSRMKGY